MASFENTFERGPDREPQEKAPCPKCGGSGKKDGKTCDNCDGKGWILYSKIKI